MFPKWSFGGLFLVGSVLLAQSPSCQPPPELQEALKSAQSARVFNAIGAHFAQAKRLACAIGAFESALRLDPASWEAHYNLALVLLEKGDVNRAVRELQVVIRQQPLTPDAHNALGTAYLRLAQPQAAEAEFRAVLKLAPNNVFALQQLSELLIEQGRHTAAVTLLASAPKDPVLQTNLAIAYSKGGRSQEALALLEQLVRAEPASAVAHFNLATEQSHQKLYRAAVVEYREALRLDPSNDLARTSLVKALNILAEYNEALAIILEYSRRKPGDFDSPYLLGEVYRGLGRYGEAVPLLQRAARMKPDHYDTQYNLGFVLAKESRFSEALAALDKAVALRPDATEARYQRGIVLRALNQPERAKEELAIFDQKRRETGKKDTAAVVGGRANQYLLAGDVPQAVESYRESLKQDPDNPRTYYNLAVALGRMGDKSGERQALDTAVKLDPTLALAQNELGLLDLQAGKTAAAEQRFKKALSLDPQYAEAQSNLGVLYGQQGRVNEAESLLRHATENNPNFAQAFLNLGLILASQNRLPEAEKEIAAAVRLAPNNTGALSSLGMVEARLGRPEEAIANFRQVISMDPKSPEAHLNLGIALADHYDLQGALAAFSEAVALSPAGPAARYNKGRAFFDLKQYPEAKVELAEACRLAPDFFEPLYLLALTEKQLDNPVHSAELLEKAVILDSRNADAQYLLGQSLFKAGQADKAIPHWRKAVEINPDHGEALYNLSRALQDKSPSEAQKYADRFASLQKKRLVTDRAGTLSNFAIVSAGARDWEQAVSQLKEAIEVCGDCPKRGDLHKNLGLIYCRSGDLENGEIELRIAQKHIPADVDVKKSLQIIATLKTKARADLKP